MVVEKNINSKYTVNIFSFSGGPCRIFFVFILNSKCSRKNLLLFFFKKYFEVTEKSTGDNVAYLVHTKLEKSDIWRVTQKLF